MEEETSFSIPDYVVFAIVLMFSSAIGIYYAICGGRQKTSGEFLMADRSMGFFPVAMSLIASLFTGIFIQGVTADVYFRGTMFWWNVIPQAVTCWIAGRCFLPIYFKLELTSIYEYLELRFSPLIRNIGLIICYFFMILHSGVATFAASLALKAVTGIELTVAVFILSGVCMFYTALGGMKAVLWADCFQMFLVFGGLFCAIIEGALNVGGLKEVWNIAEDNGRIIFDNFSFDAAEYATFWNIAIFGAVGWLPAQAISQYQIQRYLTCKDFKTANLALTTYAIGCVIVTSLCCLAGLCIFAYYAGCDPYTEGKITFRDEILPYFIVNTMQRYPGIPGLLIAGLCCLALSTVSSVENALTAVTGQHFIKGFWPNIPESTYTLINKGLVLLFGGIIIGATFLMSIMGDLVPTLLGIIGVTNSPILGVFCLGIFSKRTTSKGAFIGFVSSVALGLWILIGSLQYPSHPKSLDLSTEECQNEDYVYNATTVVYSYVTEWFNVTTEQTVGKERPPIARLYSVSKLWYPSISFGACIFFGVLGTLLTGLGDPFKVEDKLICHLPSACCFWLPKKWRTWEEEREVHDFWDEKPPFKDGEQKSNGKSPIKTTTTKPLTPPEIKYDIYEVKNGSLPEVLPMLDKETIV